MSPDLFNLQCEMVMREIKEIDGIRLNGHISNNIIMQMIRYGTYAEENLQGLLNGLNEDSEGKDLRINKSKPGNHNIKNR